MSNSIENKDEMLALAKSLYMSYKSRKEISDETGLSESKIKYFAASSWFQERENTRTDLVKSFQKGKNFLLSSIASSGLQVLEITMKTWAKSGKVLNFQEAATISKIITEMDKIINTKPSTYDADSSENGALSQPEIIEILSLDPFYCHTKDVVATSNQPLSPVTSNPKKES